MVGLMEVACFRSGIYPGFLKPNVGLAVGLGLFVYVGFVCFPQNCTALLSINLLVWLLNTHMQVAVLGNAHSQQS